MKVCRAGLHSYEGSKGCPECSKANHDKWVAKNLTQVRAREKKWREDNRTQFLATVALWNSLHGDKEANIKRLRLWIKQNPGKVMAKVRKYQASKINATPPWLTDAQKREIQDLYIKAAETKSHVDHIVPLRGKDVCGLHVPWNLQILTPEQNRKKGNRCEVSSLL